MDCEDRLSYPPGHTQARVKSRLAKMAQSSLHELAPHDPQPQLRLSARPRRPGCPGPRRASPSSRFASTARRRRRPRGRRRRRRQRSSSPAVSPRRGSAAGALPRGRFNRAWHGCGHVGARERACAPPPACRAVGRALGESVGRSAGRPGGRPVGRSVGRSAGRSDGRSGGRAVGRTFGQSVGRWVVRRA